MKITPEQCRAARGLLNWTQPTLAKAAGLTRETIAYFETKAKVPYPRNQQAIREALEKAGIEFIEENGGGAGLRFRDRQP